MRHGGGAQGMEARSRNAQVPDVLVQRNRRGLSVPCSVSVGGCLSGLGGHHRALSAELEQCDRATESTNLQPGPSAPLPWFPEPGTHEHATLLLTRTRSRGQFLFLFLFLALREMKHK